MTEVDDAAATYLAPPRERHVLILDLSKSMLAPLPDPENPGPEKQKIEVARTAVYRILENAENQRAFFGLVTFTENVRVAVPLTEIRHENLPYLESLISMLMPSGRSAIWDALAVGADLLRAGDGAVRGNLVLVTDGWDNASQRFEVHDPRAPPSTGSRTDLVSYLLPPQSQLTFRVIGIGNGAERDKGVDSQRMNTFLTALNTRAAEIGSPPAFTYQEVVTGSQLFAQMVYAFLDIDYEGARSLDQLHPEELARNAASAARALKEPQQHATVTRLTGQYGNGVPAGAGVAADGPALEVDVLSAPNGLVPPYLRERYGPLGTVIEAYLSRDFDGALDRLRRAAPLVPAVTSQYWAARIYFARGEIVDAARSLLQAWGEAEKLPAPGRARVLRRLALLQARMQNDKETETLVHFIDETETRLSHAEPGFKGRLIELFGQLMELRGTYQLTRLGNADTADAAQRHEAAVEQIFGRLQDLRLEAPSADPTIEGALDFIEICLAEMR